MSRQLRSEPRPAPSVFDQFDRIRIVSLRERSDRRAEMIEQFRAMRLENSAKLKFFDAFRMPDAGPFRAIGSHGNFLSHLAILKEAAEAGESVLVLEDDCDFLPEVERYQIPDGWDIFYGGFTASNAHDLHRSHIVGSHCMAFSARAAALAADYLEKLLDPTTPPEPIAAAEPGFNPAIRPSIDGAYVWLRRSYPELKTVFALLSRQRPSRSDVAPPKFFDQLPILKNIAPLARKLKRKLRR
jgi:glycosyl transferase family 25